MCVHIYHYNIYAHSVCALKTIYCLCFTLLLIISVCTHNKLYLCIHNCASIHLPSSFHSLNSIKLFQAEKNCDCELDNVGMHDNTATNYHKNEKMESPWKSNEQFALWLSLPRLICCHISLLYRILLFLKGAIVTLDVNALNWIFFINFFANFKTSCGERVHIRQGMENLCRGKFDMNIYFNLMNANNGKLENFFLHLFR